MTKPELKFYEEYGSRELNGADPESLSHREMVHTLIDYDGNYTRLKQYVEYLEGRVHELEETRDGRYSLLEEQLDERD